MLNCNGCKFWDQQAPSPYGLCRARAPLTTGFARTMPSEWCGDAQPKINLAPAARAPEAEGGGSFVPPVPPATIVNSAIAGENAPTQIVHKFGGKK